MASLTSRTVAASYKELLKISQPGGLGISLAPVEDGAGAQSPLNLSQTQVKISSLATSFSIDAPTSFTKAVSFTGDATFSSLTLSNLGSQTAPIPVGFLSSLIVNGANNNSNSNPAGGTLNKVTLHNTTISSLATDLSVADGGTGTGTFTQNGILYGNSTSALQATTAGTEGQLLVAGANGTPSFVTRSPVITVQGDATGVVTLTNLGSATLTLTIPSGQIVDADITGPISEAKLANLTTAGKVSGTAINSGTIGGSAAINISGSIATTSTITATGNISGADGSFSTLRVRGLNRTYTFPDSDGTSGQVLTTNGGGFLSWSTAASGGSGGSGGLASVSADANPTLGGDLRVAGYKIVSTSSGNIVIEPNGSGTTQISKVATPSAGTDAANKTYVDTAITSAASTAQYNADKIRGVTVSSTTPTTTGQVLAYDSTTSQYAPSAMNVAGFFGFKVVGSHLFVDYGNDNFIKSNYEDTIFAPFSSVILNANGRLVGTF
jgi:hypothetical protein